MYNNFEELGAEFRTHATCMEFFVFFWAQSRSVSSSRSWFQLEVPPKKWLVSLYFFLHNTISFRNYLTSVYSFAMKQYYVILIKFAVYRNQNKTRNVFKFWIYVRSSYIAELSEY
jgi:hypothetical protein